MNTEEYRQHEHFLRNREIWKYKFIDNWSFKTISTFFDIPAQEIKEIIAKHKLYFQEEYE